ncbi:MAG: TonB-dependent receptor [Muribaculaceae bacterium]|nr:TonB-dependent receptor [Muribaculaceae bacterium]
MKKIYIIMLLAAFTLNGAHAQDNTNLSKEITLEKDIAPLEKKAVKKNELPKVQKTTPTGQKTQLGYSDLTTPIDVPTSIPTLLPYGYRTAHNFSNKRGYLDIGAGTQANFRVDFGYRILNEEREKLGVWFNHNSSWNSKNPSKVITLDADRSKQKFNDNVLGVDYSKSLGTGTLSLGAQAHIDNYNYYGGWNQTLTGMTDGVSYAISPYCDWNSEKQTFVDFNINAGWASRFMLRDNFLNYKVGLQYGHAAYDKPFNEYYKHGAHDNWGILTLGGSYDINELNTAALTIKGEYLRRGAKAKTSSVDDLFDEAGMITLSPTYTVRGDMFKLQLGVNAHLSFSDGAFLRLTPNVRFNLALVDGFSFYANALGGKSLGYRVPTHYYNHRYDYPLLMYGSIYTPLDAETGFKIGPFQGLSGKLSFGYAIVKDQPGICYMASPELIAPLALKTGMMSTYTIIDGQGYWLGAELNYKYRSLIEATASIKYAPHDNELFKNDDHYNNYKLGVDRASAVGNLDIKVHPWHPLTFDVGLEYRGGRMALFRDAHQENESYLVQYTFVDMDDVINLHAGANYRLNSSTSLWLKAHNLLNRRYDLLYGQGAQRIGFMGGVSLTF